MDKNSKIYVSGHKGLAGSALVKMLREKSYNNLILKTSEELDLRNQRDIEKFLKEETPEYIFHFAAKVGGINATNSYPAEFLYKNIMITTNLIHASYKHKVKKLLYLGSSCVYPRDCPQPMKEEDLLSDKLEPTNEGYALSKIVGLKLCEYYNKQYRTNFISIMIPNLFGPNDNFDLETSHVFPGIIRKFYLAKLLSEKRFDDIINNFNIYGNNFISGRKQKNSSKEEIVRYLSKFGVTSDSAALWGSGEPYREFLYTEDLARACLFVMNKGDFKNIDGFINVGSGREIQIKELAEIIKNAVGFRGKIVWDGSKPDGMRKKLLDSSKIEKLGWKAKYSLDEALKKTYEWFERQQVSCKNNKHNE